MRDYRVRIESVTQLGGGYFIQALRCPEIAQQAQPGQFVMVAARESIDPLLRRPMAVYGLLRDGATPVGITILVQRCGRGTSLMSQARPGDWTRVLGPLGRPFEPVAGDLEHVLVMGGVGAAPFPLLAARLCAASQRVHAFVGGRSHDNILCVDEFESLGVSVEVSTEDGSVGHRGLVTDPLSEYLQGRSPVALYSCGPTAMMRAVDEIARRHGAAHQVSLEAPMGCGIGVCLSCVVPVRDGDGWRYQRICREGPVFNAASLLWGP